MSRKIAMLIDADNISPYAIASVIEQVENWGQLMVKRIYGNWRKETMKGWVEAAQELALHPVQQFDYVTGKNATDMALTIEGVELFHEGLYDEFVIVSSDSDYTPLAVFLREKGASVVGIGNDNTAQAFRKSCHQFYTLSYFSSPPPQPAVQRVTVRVLKKMPDPVPEPKPESKLEKVHRLLREAWNIHQDQSGYVFMGISGGYIHKQMPDIQLKDLGFSSLSSLLAAFPGKYEMRDLPQKGRWYRCLN